MLSPDFPVNPVVTKAWGFFYTLSLIPRPSLYEEQIRQWLIGLTEKNGWTYKLDEVRNIVIYVPGKGTLADHEPLILQGHLDMVCEKDNATKHDFYTEGLKLVNDGEWVSATGTTLGADNGVAIAFALALAEEDFDNRLPLELLFTMAEETGLIGAHGLQPELLTGKTMINIDTEDEGTFIIGCAGGEMVEASFNTIGTEVQTVLDCELIGLKGGHSGLNVTTRHNAIITVGKILEQCSGVKLHVISAGDMDNAIPRSCKFTISGITESELQKATESLFTEIKKTEPDVCLVSSVGTATQELSVDTLKFLTSFKNGASSYHPDFKTIIETSSSLTVVKTKKGVITFFINTRSSSEVDKAAFNNEVEQLALSCKAIKVERNRVYPGWQPNKNSKILKACTEVYTDLYGQPPEITSIHAGLECGIIGEKINSTEMVSMGPTIEHPHSPEERLNIKSFESVYLFLTKIIQNPVT